MNYHFKVIKQVLKPKKVIAAAKSLQSCPTLCDPIDDSSPGSPVPGILQARTLEWVAIPFSNAWKWSCSVVLTLSDPMDCSLPGSSIHVIFQARGLEWGAIAFSKRVIKFYQIIFQAYWDVYVHFSAYWCDLFIWNYLHAFLQQSSNIQGF